MTHSLLFAPSVLVLLLLVVGVLYPLLLMAAVAKSHEARSTPARR